jgi:hypothetical protein
MTIDREKVLELAVHVKLATEAIVTAAHHLAGLRPDGDAAGRTAAWTQTMDELIAMNIELGCMERILRGTLRDTGVRAAQLQPRLTRQ